jgi:hypothetical protein
VEDFLDEGFEGGVGEAVLTGEVADLLLFAVGFEGVITFDDFLFAAALAEVELVDIGGEQVALVIWSSRRLNSLSVRFTAFS